LTKSVRRKHGTEDSFRSDHARFVMDGLVRCAGLVSHLHQLSPVAIPKANVHERGRQADVLTERVNGCYRFSRRVCKLEAGRDAKGNFFAVVERMGFRQRGQTIVNGMSRRQPGAFKADSNRGALGLSTPSISGLSIS
jgi:hypothetical protein